MPSANSSHRERANPAAFRTTHWTVILAASDRSAPNAEQALAKLCQDYHYPLYAYIRRSGRNQQDAEDLTQAFFARLLQNNFLDGIEREGGKFRSFLLTALKRFTANELDRAKTQKRGGDVIFVSLSEDSEERYRCEPVEEMTPERLFERRWAFTLLDQVMDELRHDYQRLGKGRLFDLLQPFLAGSDNAASYADVAQQLGMTEGAIKVAVHRLKKRYGQLIREQIERTVSRPEEVNEEIRHLISVSVAFGYSHSSA